MFVVSVKSSKKKITLMLMAMGVLLLIAIGLGVNKMVQSTLASGTNSSASNNEERCAFLSQFGWEVSPEPIEVKEVVIPAEFDEVYNKYNEIQKNQGFDLEKYASMRVKRWTYEVKNYPGYENSSAIRANLLVYDSMVIGGDISCIELNGFMHGFEKENTAVAEQ
ncbi:MAG: DUF4830 domain-containing protein [Clostridiales bacterium]|nr:DUF4830 domain-containing protein [Clostridiales bacterium]